MKRHYFLFFAAMSLLFLQCSSPQNADSQSYEVKEATSKGYRYKYVTNDPMKVRMYTLENGLRVYLSAYDATPRVYTSIAVHAGGQHDPADNTGLAHYLEHIMFKGTSSFGTNDWAKESPLLDSVERLYEAYRGISDEAARRAHYALIDKVSNEASRYAIPNEYDKMLAFIGADGTNAYTSNDRTVYINDVPSNQIENWLRIEADRFKVITPRLFHTELETVYEEKNRTLDNDGRRAYEAMARLAFKGHPYGTQTVIGTIEHLQNPSISEIKKFFNTYYRPNNVTLCASGDLDYDKVIALIDKHFGSWAPNESLPSLPKADAEPITQVVEEDVVGPDAEWVQIAFRFGGRSSADFQKLNMADFVLANSQAGLIDLNLGQAQKVLSPSSFVYDYNDYSLHILYGRPREGQSLEEVRDLLLAQVDSLKQGAFPDWLLDAVRNDFKRNRISSMENNRARTGFMVETATAGVPWEDFVGEIDALKGLSKQDIIDFATQHYRDNYVVVYKRSGAHTPPKIEKPVITPVTLNREQVSDFQQALLANEVEDISPKFIDYSKDIQTYEVGSLTVHHVPNSENDRFSLYYYSDLNNRHDPTAQIAIRYLDYLAPEGMTSEAFKQELYKIGVEMSASTGNDNSYIRLEGLSEHTTEAIALLERLLASPQSDEEALSKLKEGIKKERADQMKNKNAIRSRLIAYGRYGQQSPATNVLTDAQLDDLSPEDLLSIIRNFSSMDHRVLYYGPLDSSSLRTLLEEYHKIPEKLTPLREVSDFSLQEVVKPNVYFTHYNMVQAEMLLLSRNELYDPSLHPKITLFNEYFGGGMSSVVFQELREARGLAYSAFARYSQGDAGDYNSFFMYIGSQADKQTEAIAAMQELLQQMPSSEKSLEIAKNSLINQLRTRRITREGILFSYENAKRKGLDYDIRRSLYDEVQQMSLSDVQRFHAQHIQTNKYNLLVLGSRDRLDIAGLSNFGTVAEIDFQTLFGYNSSTVPLP